MRCDYREMNRNQHFVKSGKEERTRLLSFLESEGFRIDGAGYSEEEIMSSPFPVAVDMKEKTVSVLGGAAIAAAAASSDVILTAEEYYSVYQ